MFSPFKLFTYMQHGNDILYNIIWNIFYTILNTIQDHNLASTKSVTMYEIRKDFQLQTATKNNFRNVSTLGLQSTLVVMSPSNSTLGMSYLQKQTSDSLFSFFRFYNSQQPSSTVIKETNLGLPLSSSSSYMGTLIKRPKKTIDSYSFTNVQDNSHSKKLSAIQKHAIQFAEYNSKKTR